MKTPRDLLIHPFHHTLPLPRAHKARRVPSLASCTERNPSNPENQSSPMCSPLQPPNNKIDQNFELQKRKNMKKARNPTVVLKNYHRIDCYSNRARSHPNQCREQGGWSSNRRWLGLPWMVTVTRSRLPGLLAGRPDLDLERSWGDISSAFNIAGASRAGGREDGEAGRGAYYEKMQSFGRRRLGVKKRKVSRRLF